jgi:putative colanic acid biosynthesis acetyltransferase WcaF
MDSQHFRAERLDVAACREARPYRNREYIARVLWALTTPLFRFSPRPLFGWRRLLLRAFGARVGRDAHVYPSARIYLPWMLTLGEQASIGEWALIYNLGPVTIGDRATISHWAHLCAGTHDYRDPALPLLRLPIEIGAQAWVCADAFIGPGRRVGEGAIVGASAVVVSDVPDWQIAAGNPARIIKQRLLRCPEEEESR